MRLPKAAASSPNSRIDSVKNDVVSLFGAQTSELAYLAERQRRDGGPVSVDRRGIRSTDERQERLAHVHTDESVANCIKQQLLHYRAGHGTTFPICPVR